MFEALRESDTLEEVHEVALSMAPRLALQLPTARNAFVRAVTRACCRLLLRGWPSLEAASAETRYLGGLREDSLLEPLRDVQRSVAEALLKLCGSGGGGRGGGDAGSVSWRSWEASSSSSASLEFSLCHWVSLSRLAQSTAESGLLSADAAEAVAGVLEVELRRRLCRATAHDVSRVVSCLEEGSSYISRAVATAATAASTGGKGSTASGGSGGGAVATAAIRPGGSDDPLPRPGIRAVVADTLRAAESRAAASAGQPEGPAAAAAAAFVRAALDTAGFLVPVPSGVQMEPSDEHRRPPSSGGWRRPPSSGGLTFRSARPSTAGSAAAAAAALSSRRPPSASASACRAVASRAAAPAVTPAAPKRPASGVCGRPVAAATPAWALAAWSEVAKAPKEGTFRV